MIVEVDEDGDSAKRFFVLVDEGGEDDRALDEPEVGEVGDDGDTTTGSLKEWVCTNC